MTFEATRDLIMGAIADFGLAIASVLAGVVTIGVAYLVFRTGWAQLAIYNGVLGQRLRYFGKPPWKGYNRWRSMKWNMEHTA